jgi:N-acetylglucosaminyl-diphospho-decaprenol L-rhamnosyltransferase
VLTDVPSALAFTAPDALASSAHFAGSIQDGTRVEVVIVAYNSAETLRACAEPLAQVPWVDVIVVDNACPEDSSRVVEDLPVSVIRSERNGGFAYGCNLGIESGSAEFVLLLNPDAQIDAANLAALVAALAAEPTLAAVGPRVTDRAGGLLFTQRRFPRLRSTFAQGLFLHRAAPLATWADDAIRDPGAYERPGRPEWLSGCCVLLRREAVASVGGLDEGFFLYAEETDLFKRLAANGWTAGYEPGATSWHEGQGSADANATEPIRAASRVRYARKHHGRMIGALEGAGLALGALMHALMWVHKPSRALGHLAAARTALRAIRSGRVIGG